MKKYIAFMKVALIQQYKNLLDEFGNIGSFCVHVIVFSFLWDFVLQGKTMAGYTKQELIWYVIIGEEIMYSFHHYYRKVAYKVEMGDFAYDMTKPFNFLIRTIVEGLAELPTTLTLFVVGIILGNSFAGMINMNFTGVLLSLLVFILAVILLLIFNVLIGLLAIWFGKDVSSIWLLVQKAMLIFAFTPIELFPKAVQKVMLMLPTTHVVYTPASLFVHFSRDKFISSCMYITIAFLIGGLALYIIYKKGVKKQNVNGI